MSVYSNENASRAKGTPWVNFHRLRSRQDIDGGRQSPFEVCQSGQLKVFEKNDRPWLYDQAWNRLATQIDPPKPDLYILYHVLP